MRIIMMPDKEIIAMSAIADVLSPLRVEVRRRVLHWAANRFCHATLTEIEFILPWEAKSEDNQSSSE